tara:strand:- start:49 stop:966 length:918 start_codon:yes stop_codon:yes gene_type:complete
MSNNIIGSTKSLPLSKNIPIHGNCGIVGKVNIDVKSLVNRATHATQIKKLLKPGFDWALFTFPIVAVFPDGKEYLLDGDHRRAIYACAYPDKETMPCIKIQVSSEKEYHKLFYQINWSQRKNANREQVFVHQVLAEEKDALALRDQLIRCNLCICGSPEEYGTVGAPNSKRITKGAFQKSLKRGEENVKAAVQMLSETWPEDEKIQGELLEGITILFSLHKCFSDGSIIDVDFKNWFKNHMSIYTQHSVASDYKIRGGRVHHKHGESIAHGLILEYRKVNGGCNLQYKQRKVRLSKTAKLIGLNG